MFLSAVLFFFPFNWAAPTPSTCKWISSWTVLILQVALIWLPSTLMRLILWYFSQTFSTFKWLNALFCTAVSLTFGLTNPLPDALEYIITAERYDPGQQRIVQVAQTANLNADDFPYTFPQTFGPGYYRGRIDAVRSSGVQTLSVGDLVQLGTVGRSKTFSVCCASR